MISVKIFRVDVLISDDVLLLVYSIQYPWLNTLLLDHTFNPGDSPEYELPELLSGDHK